MSRSARSSATIGPSAHRAALVVDPADAGPEVLHVVSVRAADAAAVVLPATCAVLRQGDALCVRRRVATPPLCFGMPMPTATHRARHVRRRGDQLRKTGVHPRNTPVV